MDGEDALEKEMATQASILAQETPWTEEPSELQSMGSKKGLNNREAIFIIQILMLRYRYTDTPIKGDCDSSFEGKSACC